MNMAAPDPTTRRKELQQLLGDEPLKPELQREVEDAADRLFSLEESQRGPLRPGDLLDDRYRIVAQLGAGGQAFAYRARDEQADQDVAVKVPRPEVASRLLHEAHLMERLEHPHIVRVEHVEPTSDPPYLVLEYCAGGSLVELLERHPEGLPLDRVAQIAIAVLDGLAFLHSQGVVHRDLKPANILLTSDGRIRIADFGIGTLSLADAPELVQSLPVSDAGLDVVGGTPLYMAPEQEDPGRLKGAPLDGRADLYAFGKVLYGLLTGASPRTVRPPSRLRPELSSRWDELVFQLLEEDPASRYSDAGAVKDALGLALTKGKRPPRPEPDRSETAAFAFWAICWGLAGAVFTLLHLLVVPPFLEMFQDVGAELPWITLAMVETRWYVCGGCFLMIPVYWLFQRWFRPVLLPVAWLLPSLLLTGTLVALGLPLLKRLEAL